MSTGISSNSSEDSFISSELPVSRSVRFWPLLLTDIPSAVCSVCLIIHIVSDRTRRYALYSHTILAILLYNLPTQFIEVGFHLFFLRYGRVQPSVPLTCLFWWFIDYGLFAGVTMLYTWLAIERHILIFHDRWVASQRGRFLFHYLPLTTIVAYNLLFYTSVIFFLPCKTIYDYSTAYCGSAPCYESHPILSLWEFIFHYCAPVMLEVIVSTALIIRVQYHKRRLHQSRNWRKQRRMIIQLALVSGINNCLILPYYIISIAQYCGLSSESFTQIELWFYYLSYWVIFLFPFISLFQFPLLHQQIGNKLRNMVARRPRHAAIVAPANGGIPMNRLS